VPQQLQLKLNHVLLLPLHLLQPLLPPVHLPLLPPLANLLP